MKNKQRFIIIGIIIAGLLLIVLDISLFKQIPESGSAIGLPMVSDTDGMTLLYVPAGEFIMGRPYSTEPQESKTERGRFVIQNENPQHTVMLDAFWIDKTEVTQEMYAHCVAEGICREPFCANNAGDNYPVTCISRDDAADYCIWAGRQLPTEAQWEKAARGTDGRTYSWGNEPATCELAVINNGTGMGFCDKDNKVWTVGSKPDGASPYGALDMAGNAWEWVADWFGADYYAESPANNPTGPETGQFATVRGGGMFDYYWYDVRTTTRVLSRVSWRDSNLGFRCAMPADQ
ncbi:MAG: SUMF1/EgtB/PvdO family nonheme iron enzyme [Anaerolineaceae bacterium]|nr:SUMF1/EgtB/PvdO family nonheme iron enzyme [Anaerolineaceae bacterium]